MALSIQRSSLAGIIAVLTLLHSCATPHPSTSSPYTPSPTSGPMAPQPTEPISGQVVEPTACSPQVLSISNATPADIAWSDDSRHLLYRLHRDDPEWLAFNVEARSPLPEDERPQDTPLPPLASLLADRGIDPALSSVSPSGCQLSPGTGPSIVGQTGPLNHRGGGKVSC